MNKLDAHDKHIDESSRQKRKSSKITEGPHITGTEKLKTQGKGDNYRPLPGWYSKETKKKLEKIFEKEEASDKETDEGSTG